MEHQIKSAIGQEHAVYFSAKEEKRRGVSHEIYTAKRYVSGMSKISDLRGSSSKKDELTSRKFYFINDAFDKVYVRLDADDDGMDTTGEKSNWFASPANNGGLSRFLHEPVLSSTIFDNDPDDVRRLFHKTKELFVLYESENGNEHLIQNAMTGEIIEKTPDFKTIASIEEKVKIELKDYIMDVLAKAKIQRNEFWNTFNNADDAWMVEHGFKFETIYKGRKSYGRTKKHYVVSDEYSKPIELQLAEYKEILLLSILKSLEKHKATDFKSVYVSKRYHLIQGIFEIGDGRKAHFWSVGAGGYNIQTYHHRYFVHLTKSDAEVEAIKLNIQLKKDAEKALEENDNEV